MNPKLNTFYPDFFFRYIIPPNPDFSQKTIRNHTLIKSCKTCKNKFQPSTPTEIQASYGLISFCN